MKQARESTRALCVYKVVCNFVLFVCWAFVIPRYCILLLRYKHSTWSLVCRNMNIEYSGKSSAPWGVPTGIEAFQRTHSQSRESNLQSYASKNIVKKYFHNSQRVNYVHISIEILASLSAFRSKCSQNALFVIK